AKESGLYNVSAWFTDGSTYTGKACRYYLSCSDGRPRPIVTPEDFGSGINTPTMQKGDVSVWLNAGDYFDIKVQTSSSGPASIDESEVIIAKIQ
ncbi:MAG TPA: hypothetical protein VFK37_05995, partial [Bacillales bacterium]|nr:hypothetical protein [Bacillales bacterium]